MYIKVYIDPEDFNIKVDCLEAIEEKNNVTFIVNHKYKFRNDPFTLANKSMENNLNCFKKIFGAMPSDFDQDNGEYEYFSYHRKGSKYFCMREK